MLGLGRLYDVGCAWAPVDLNTAGATGLRISMEDCGGIDLILFYGKGTANDDPIPSIQEHTAYTGGDSANLVVIDTIYRKTEDALDNDEIWVKTEQTAAYIMTAIPTDAEKQQIYVIHVPAAALSAGYTHISVDEADPAAAKLAAGLYLKVDLKRQRTPANLPNLLNPGAANA